MSDTTYRFGAFELLARRQLLLHAGVPVTIGSRALALLTRLVEGAGELVGKDELTAAAWPDTFVHEANLKVNIGALRRGLSLREPRQEYIVAVPGRGYRFVGPVTSASHAHVISTTAMPFAALPAGTSLLGRAAEVDAVCESMAAHRLVTLAGTGGVGKTAIAIAAAHRLRDRFDGGASFVDLALVGDPQHLPATLSAELGIHSDREDLVGAVIQMLHGQRRLLVLDNCEHLLPAVAAVADRLRAALPDLRILATSREPLRLAEEHVLRIDGLDVPTAALAEADPDAALAFPAIALFQRRAREATGTEIGRADVAVVVRICRRLDGLPLAIELAAARYATCPPADLLRQLDAGFDLADVDGSRPDRHRTLRATLAWSYALLRPHEAAVLRALAVFSRSFTVEDALAIAEAVVIAPSDALEGIASLVSKSLLSVGTGRSGLRYRLLESTRAFGVELLANDPLRDRIQHGHAEHVRLSLERAQRELEHEPSEGGASNLSLAAADVRRALAWCFGDSGSASLGIRLTLAAIPLWETLSLLDESIRHLSTAIDACRRAGAEVAATEVRLQIAFATAILYARGVGPESEAAWTRALLLSEKVAHAGPRMRALWGSALYELHVGRPAMTAAKLHHFAELCRTLGDPSSALDGERLLSAAEMYLGRLASARTRLEGVVAGELAAGPSGAPRYQIDRESAIGSTLAMLKWLSGDAAGAVELVERTLERTLLAGHPVSICHILILSAVPIALLDGRLDDADRYMTILRAQLEGRRMTLWAQVARCQEAALVVRRGVAGGVIMLEHAIGDLVRTGATIRVSFYQSILAAALAKDKGLAEAEDAIANARARAASQQELWVVPEVMRVQATILARRGQHQEAMDLLNVAIDAARAIGAEAWRVRAAQTLAELTAAPR